MIALVVAALHLVLLAGSPGLTLSEDEAYYWEWSRFPALGYATKPGGVAWVIALSTRLLGDTALAVRLPAAIAGAIGSLAVGMLAWDMTRNRRVAVFSTLAYACTPAFAMLAFLMTIDGPMLAAWAIAAWSGHRAMILGRWPWIVLGAAAVGVGMQFKQTMLLALVGVPLFYALVRTERPRIAWRWIGVASLVIVGALVPTLVFNVQHDWVQVRHLMGHLGYGENTGASKESHPWSLMWTLEYPLLQVAMGGATAVLGVIGAVKLLRRKPSAQMRASVMWCIALAMPVFIGYFGVTLAARVEANWPIGAWVTACPLAAWAAWLGVAEKDKGLRAGALIGVVIGVVLLVAPPLAPLLAGRTIGGLAIPVHRLTGFEVVARHVEDTRVGVRSKEGAEPIIMAVSYGRTAQLAFSLPDHPTVYATARYTNGGQGRQYDLWPHTDLESPDLRARLNGRTGVMLGGSQAHWARAFERVECVDSVENEPGKTLGVFVGHGFRGFGS